MELYHAQLTAGPPYGSDVVQESDIRSLDDFFLWMKQMDAHIREREQNFSILLHRASSPLQWECEPHKNGGRFYIFFGQNTIAFRTFCVLAHDWMNGLVGFDSGILGLIIHFRPSQYIIQVWVDNGRDPATVANYWRLMKDWLFNENRGKLTKAAISLEFHVHKNVKPPPAARQVQQINQAEAPADKPKPIPFNLEVARKHKRKWSEKRSEQERDL